MKADTLREIVGLAYRNQRRVFAAISVNLPDDTVDFVEIFPPMSLDDYQKQFYTDPASL